MSYLVFARKYRPLTFADVIGQEHITRTIIKAIEKNRVAHAYLFSGTRGVGKTTTARIMARALNCEKGPTPNPCGVCDPCKTVMSGSSFDVIEIDGASNNRVEDIRELRDNVGYSSMGGKYRIFVIDEVHMLSKSAFNALLKTLEEPPKNVVFIFATTEPQKIPETIHSRCQRYDFRRISSEQILGQLETICAKEQVTAERGGLLLVARKADGSMRDALSLLDQVYSFCPDGITEAEVRTVLGLVSSEFYITILSAVTDKDPARLLSTVDKALFAGYDLFEFIMGFEEFLRGALLSRVPGMESAEASSSEAQAATASLSEPTVLRMIEVIRKAEQELKWSTFGRFVVEIALLKLMYLDQSIAVEELLSVLRGSSAVTTLPVAAASTIGSTADAVKKKAPLNLQPIHA